MSKGPEAVAFLQDLIRTPSLSGDGGEIVALIEQRMLALGFEETRIDPFGNVMVRIDRGASDQKAGMAALM